MNKIIQIKIFNGILDQFFEFLEDSFPIYRADILLTKNATEFVRKSNPRLVVEQFMNQVTPYKEHIFNCDEDYFLHYNANGELIIKIKQIWKSNEITELDKAKIFYYFQKLIKSGILCN